MKLGEIADIYIGLTKIRMAKIEMAFSELRKISQFQTALKNDYDLYSEREFDILKKYGNESEFKPGHFSIKDGFNYNKDKAALRNEEIEFELPKIGFPITVPVTERLQLSMDDYDALQPYIKFEEDNLK